MEKMGIGFWIITAIELILTIVCWSFAFMVYQPGYTSGVWLFIAFGMLFAIPLFFSVLRLVRMKSIRLQSFYDKATGANQRQSTRFVPHWFMMAAIAILGIIVLYVVIFAILSSLR
jgi:small-conductance mechanosensitive channel